MRPVRARRIFCGSIVVTSSLLRSAERACYTRDAALTRRSPGTYGPAAALERADLFRPDRQRRSHHAAHRPDLGRGSVDPRVRARTARPGPAASAAAAGLAARASARARQLAARARCGAADGDAGRADPADKVK